MRLLPSTLIILGTWAGFTGSLWDFGIPPKIRRNSLMILVDAFFVSPPYKPAITLGLSSLDGWYDIKMSTLRKNGGGALMNVYNNSPYAALRAIYPKHNWVLFRFKNSPNRLWRSEENRKVRWTFIVHWKSGFCQLDRLTTRHSKSRWLVPSPTRHGPFEIPRVRNVELPRRIFCSSTSLIISTTQLGPN